MLIQFKILEIDVIAQAVLNLISIVYILKMNGEGNEKNLGLVV